MKAVRDLRFQTEAGINYINYGERVSKIYVDFRNFSEKHPNSKLTRSFGKIMLSYLDAKEIWRRAIFENEEFVDYNTLGRYPIEANYIEIKLRRGSNKFEWHYKNILQDIWEIAARDEQAVQKMIDDIY